jgi:hypothetical protein
MLLVLGFSLNPVTFAHLVEWYTRQWDAYAT